MGWCLYWMIIEVFSNCNDSAILWKDRGAWITTLCSPWNECHVSWQPHGPGKLFRQSNWDHWSLQELLSPGTRSGPMPHCFSFLMLFVSFTSKFVEIFPCLPVDSCFQVKNSRNCCFPQLGLRLALFDWIQSQLILFAQIQLPLASFYTICHSEVKIVGLK